MFNFIDFRKLTTTTLLGILMAGNLIVPSTSAQDSSPNEITLTGTVRDFSDDHPDFERSPGQQSADGSTFSYGLDTNITTGNIGWDQKPVYKGGSYSTTNKANFDQWYRDISGVNESKELAITLTKQPNGVYRYENTNFFPINNQMIGNEGRNKNFHFTYELHTRFTYNGGEVFNFRGDDDVWVYINGKKVIDIGGVHSAVTRNVSLDDIADAAGIETGKSYTLDFFFAERHTTQSNLIIETTLELETAPEVGGDNACILDWSEVLAADSDGWVTDSGEDGTRDDLYRVYYHEPSGKYVKVTVDQRWDWGGASGSDSYPYSPKIVDYSKWGTGGFDGEDMFLFSMKTKRDQVNRLTIEFFEDAQLNNKADVSNLNFTLTDLDGSGSNKGRENIIVSAENSFGSLTPIEIYRPEGSVIKDNWINGGNVLGKKNGIKGPEGNVAPVLLGDTHKVEIVYQLAPNSGEKNQVRHMYVSDLAWCGEAVNVTPEEEVDIEEVLNPDDDDDDTSTQEDSDGNGIPDIDEEDPNEDTDGDGVKNEDDDDDDGNGIPDKDEIGSDPDNPIDTDGDDVPDYQDLDDDDNGIPDKDEIGQYPDNPIDSDGDGTPNYKDDDDDDNGIPDKDEIGNDPGKNPGYDVNGDGTPDIYPNNSDDDSVPDYLDDDDDNNGIPDKDEIGNDPDKNPGYDVNGDGTPDIYPDNFDGDEIPDYLDPDDDNDGIDDKDEIGNPANPTNTDGNYGDYGDDEPDYQDDDSDGDGIKDVDEGPEDSDEDGTPDYKDWDSDNPNGSTVNDIDDPDYIGLPDDIDSDPDNPDNDDDGIPDDDELIADADGDGQPDITVNDLPEGATIDNVDDDKDEDGNPIYNYDDPDSDNDGLSDEAEDDDDGPLNPYIKNYAD